MSKRMKCHAQIKKNIDKANKQYDKDSKDPILEMLGNSMAWIVLGVIETHAIDGNGKEFVTAKKMCNFYDFIIEEKRKWIGAGKGIELMELTEKNKIWILEGSRQISFTNYLKLSQIKPGRSTNSPYILKAMQSGWIVIMYWVDEVLKNHYRMSKEERIDIMTWVIDWIDSYGKKLMTLDSINDIFIEELGWNVATGEKVG